MDPFKNLQDTWKAQKIADLPDLKSIKKSITKTRNKIIYKNILAVVFLSLSILGMIAILFFIDFKLSTTKLAVLGMMIVIFMSIIFILRLNNQMYKADKLQDTSKAYLTQLKEFKTKQQQIQQQYIAYYYITLAILLYLYLYEFYVMDAAIGLFAYTALSLWILFAWFYIRPKTIAKQEHQINKMIKEVERIETQLTG